MSRPVLVLRDVERSYAAVTVLKGVNFTLNAGEMVGLIAPSGAGKSTLLHMAGLLDRPTAGEIEIDGRTAVRLNDTERTELRRRTIGFVYQFHHLLPEFSALENVALPQMIAGIGRKAASVRAAELLTMVGLKNRLAHRPATLSGGEQQRVAIVRAIANRPKLLLADEPTGNLDPATAETVFTELLQLVRTTGLAALIATHNLALARRMDRIVTLQKGAITAA